MKPHQTHESPELSIKMLPLCPDCRQRPENSRRWLQSPSWLWHRTKIHSPSKQKPSCSTCTGFQSASAMELQFLYPAVSESCFKTLRCTCHGQQIKHTVTPVAVQLAKLQQLSRCLGTSWLQKHSHKPIRVHRHWCNVASDDVNRACCCTYMGTLALILWAKEEKDGKIIPHQKTFENVSRWKQRHLPKFWWTCTLSEVWGISNCHFHKHYSSLSFRGL